MAISWKFNISEIGNSGNYNISATVTDDSKLEAYQEESVSIQGRMDNQEQKEKNFNTLKEQYLQKVSKTTAKAALEAEAKDYVEKK